jgi:hypothetical protein
MLEIFSTKIFAFFSLKLLVFMPKTDDKIGFQEKKPLCLPKNWRK